jgi:glucosamine-6-phosphate deaminase
LRPAALSRTIEDLAIWGSHVSPQVSRSLVKSWRVDALRVFVFDDRATAASAAADHVATAIRHCMKRTGVARAIFAAAPSQNEFLADLVAQHELDWSRLTAFHMDEYLGIPSEHPASFRNYLNQHLFVPAKLRPEQTRLISGETTDEPLRTCLEYERALRLEPTDVVCAGIGENGHLAFNDPPVADFLDPVWVKVVRLDTACRAQQVNDGCFARLEDVPTHAYTLTIPALMAAPVLSVVVPGSLKAQAVRATLCGPINEACPASVLRRHPAATLWLDRESAALLDELEK